MALPGLLSIQCGKEGFPVIYPFFGEFPQVWDRWRV